jgi:osmotically-inducible protein OsmY
MVTTPISIKARADEDIQHDVIEELKWDARVQPNDIGISVKDGIVTLTGWVDSYTKKWAAEDAALRVRGVHAVVNDVEVRLPIDAERTDKDIAAAALYALEWDAGVPLDQVQLAVSNGWITLNGEVDWQYQREDAERAVRRLTGVKGVTNLITVRSPGPAPSPAELKRQIEEALVRNATLDAQRIVVEVDGSKITLRGTVHSWAEKQEAQRVAWSAPGVTEVRNLITVV